MVKVKLVIEATFNVADTDVKAVKAATPENQLATARLQAGTVKSTIKVE